MIEIAGLSHIICDNDIVNAKGNDSRTSNLDPPEQIVHCPSQQYTNLTTASKIKKQVLQARLAFVRCENYWHLRAQTAFMQFRQSIYLLFAASPTDDEEYLYISDGRYHDYWY